MASLGRERKQLAAASFVLFCVSLFLTAYSARNPEFGRMGAAVAGSVFHPIQLANRSIFGFAFEWWGRYIALVDLKSENEQLKKRLNLLEMEDTQRIEAQSENIRLRSLLMMKERSVPDSIGASVIGYNVSGWVEGVVIDKGAFDGVARGMAVIDGLGVVGQIIATSPKSSQVLLITDHSSGIDAVVESTRVRGVVEGMGQQECALRYVLREDEVKVGDRVVTSGTDGIYPKGLLLGTVATVDAQARGMFQEITLLPAVNFERLEEVLVVTALPPAIEETKNPHLIVEPLPKAEDAKP